MKNKNQKALQSFFPRSLGFTLMELLVVILIIGILAAVALPQYNKAVAKTEAVKLLHVIKTAETAMNAYMLENAGVDKEFFVSGSWGDVDNVTDLSIDLPLTEELKQNYEWYIDIMGDGDVKEVLITNEDISMGTDFTGGYCDGHTFKGKAMCQYLREAIKL